MAVLKEKGKRKKEKRKGLWRSEERGRLDEEGLWLAF
jgi:hypothetical protein